ncbi:unnamed protein product [Arabis nemorensis]|uniref:Uncharacterized protein n=1 Tax=Arabis nemorensis TaxID=586526 RepID=A0A565BBS3_9BRAS|nr:unnamed protein product [Arabis nemorensis]
MVEASVIRCWGWPLAWMGRSFVGHAVVAGPFRWMYSCCLRPGFYFQPAQALRALVYLAFGGPSIAGDDLAIINWINVWAGGFQYLWRMLEVAMNRYILWFLVVGLRFQISVLTGQTVGGLGVASEVKFVVWMWSGLVAVACGGLIDWWFCWSFTREIRGGLD